MKDPKTERILISMSNPFLNEVDEVANKLSKSRSEFIREALRMHIARIKTIGDMQTTMDYNSMMVGGKENV